MTKSLLVFSLLFLVNACTRNDWVTYPINEHITVQLPSPPKVVNLQKQKGLPEVPAVALQHLQAFASSDDYGAYTILVNPTDSSSVLPRDSIYNAGIRDVLLAQQGRLLTRTTFSTPAGNGVEALLDVVPPNIGMHVRMGVHAVMVGQQSYVFAFVPYAETDSSLANICRRRFFDSIVVKL